MLSKKQSKKHVVIFLLHSLLLVFCPVKAWSGLTCGGVTNILGTEYIAECVDEGPPYRYVQTDIRCESGQVIKGPTQQWMNGGTAMMPAYAESGIVNAATFSSGVVFGSSTQTHYVVVTNTFAKYGGVLDGISLSSLAYGTLYVDQLSGIGVIPKDLVDLDIDNDGSIICNDCDDENAAVNPGSTEVCNDGIDNNCDGSSDCDDLACVGSPECAVPSNPDVPPGNFNRDPCLDQ